MPIARAPTNPWSGYFSCAVGVHTKTLGVKNRNTSIEQNTPPPPPPLQAPGSPSISHVIKIAYHPLTRPASQLFISRASFLAAFVTGTVYLPLLVIIFGITVAPALIAICPDIRNEVGVGEFLVTLVETVLENKRTKERCGDS